MLNRAGESIHWASNNENFFNPVQKFSEGYFFQTFFSFFLSNKAFNFFFFSFFNYFLKKNILKKNILKKNIFFKIKKRMSKKKNFDLTKNVKHAYVYNLYFFSKVFLVSYYNYIVVSIKIYSRTQKKKIFFKNRLNQYNILFFWKFFFLNYCFYTIDKNVFFKKKF